MTQQPLPILSDDDMRCVQPAGDEAGFGSLSTSKGLLPLKALEVHARVVGLLAHTTLQQTYVNSLDEPLEATYIFPLPDRAAVTHFRMEVAGRVVEGVLKERGQARREYDQAIQAGQRAAITEEERPGVFTLRVGNIMPGEEASIRLTMTGPLPYSDGEATYRFPLVVAPRYIPGTPLPGPSVGNGVAPDTDAVPDASRITPPVLLPGFPNPVRLVLDVEVQSGGLPVSDLRSSLYAVVVDEREQSWRVAVRPGERLNRDFILRFRVAETAVRTSLLVRPDEKGEEGTFLLTVVPPGGPADRQRPRDLVFVLDRSGSMGGWKMVAARRALARMVDTLTAHDRFTVYAFDDRIEVPPAFQGHGLVPATDRNRFRAVEFLAKTEARGGTELARPLTQGVGQLAGQDPERDRILVLVTDGQVGNEDQILRSLGQGVRNLRIFTLGIDRAVNEAFLKRLASLGGGCCELVESEDRLDEVMDKVHRRIGTPVLSGLHLEASGLKVVRAALVPARLPDLFAGAPLFILGRYHGKAEGAVTLQAKDRAGRAWAETVQARRTDNQALTAAWARGHLREQEDRYVTESGDKSKLEKEIVETSLKYGVMCRFTSFLAVDVKEVVNPGGEVHRVTQPVEPAAGWAMLGTDDEAECLAASATVAASAAPMALFQAMRAMPEMAAPRSAPPPPPAVSPPPASRAPRSVKAKKSVPPSGGGGLFSKLREFVGGGGTDGATSPPAPEPLDLTAYRRRALELLRSLQQAAVASAADRLNELGVLSVQMTALVEDLESIGAGRDELKPLQELLTDLRALLAKQKPADKDVGKLWSQAEAVLQAFGQAAGSPAAPAGQRREGFWK